MYPVSQYKVGAFDVKYLRNYKKQSVLIRGFLSRFYSNNYVWFINPKLRYLHIYIAIFLYILLLYRCLNSF